MTIAETTSGIEMLDDARNAATKAAQAIVGTTQELGGHEAFYEHPTFWVAVSFILAIVVLVRPVSKILHEMLVRRIDGIAERIREAENLRDDAQSLLAEYEKKFKNAENEANAILKKSQQEIEFLKQERMEKLEREMKIKQDEASNRISSARNEALQSVSTQTAELTIQTVKTVLSEKLDAKAQDKLIDNSINLIAKI